MPKWEFLFGRDLFREVPLQRSAPAFALRWWDAAGATGAGRWLSLARTKSDQALLVDRHIQHALLPEFLAQAHRAAEDASEGHVLAEDDGGLVGTQGYPAGPEEQAWRAMSRRGARPATGGRAAETL